MLLKRMFLSLFSLFTFFIASESNAQSSDIFASPVLPVQNAQERYPIRFVDRPLTLPNHVIRIDGGVQLEHMSGDTNGSMLLGGAISFAQFMELGISPHRLGMLRVNQSEGALPLRFFGDVDLGAMPIYVRFRVAELDKLDIAADGGISIPLQHSPDVDLYGALLMRVRLCERLIIDTGTEYRTTFANDNVATLTFPAIFSFQITDAIWTALRTGARWVDYSKRGFGIPLGIELGYAGGGRGDPILEVLGRFDWTQLFTPALNGNRTQAEIWILGADVRFYFPFITPKERRASRS